MCAYDSVAQRPGRGQQVLDPVLELHNGDGAVVNRFRPRSIGQEQQSNGAS